MASRSSRERELLEKAARYLPGGGSGNTNFPDSVNFLARDGRGSHIWDVSGNEYVDWLMGSGPMILGHAHPGGGGSGYRGREPGKHFLHHQ